MKIMSRLLAALAILSLSAWAQTVTISNVQAVPSATTTVITWTTNIAESSNAYCELASANNAFTRCGTKHDATLVTSHRQTFTGLLPSTQYRYHVCSGICSVNYLFTTTSGTTITLSSIAVTPATASVVVAGTRQFVATGTYSDGSTANVTASSTWSSSNTAVASVVTTTGLATGVSSGTATITATLSGKTDTATLTVNALTSSYSLFAPSLAPGVIDAGASSAQELGVTWTSDKSGKVTAIKFYKSSLNTGTHVGSVWNSVGMLLGQVTFAGETASGWQTQNLVTPVAIAANTTYVTSYHECCGHFSYTQGSPFNVAYTSGPLHVPVDGERYAVASLPTFPTVQDTSAGWIGSNWFVDFTFQPGASVLATWTASAGATSYNVYRSAGACPGTTFTKVGSGITATNFTDPNLTSGSTYCYDATAVNANGESAASTKQGAVIP